MALGPCVRRAKRRARTAQGAMLLTSVAIERRLTPTAKMGGLALRGLEKEEEMT
jgi:hypothetical protein